MLVAKSENYMSLPRCIIMSKKKFSDKQAEEAFMNAEVNSLSDVLSLAASLKKYRPALFKKIEKKYVCV